MRKIILPALLLIAPALQAAGDSQPLGTWVAVQRAPNGLGMTLTFLPDGKLVSGTAALVETWYRTDGDKFIQPGATAADKPTTARFHIEGNTLQFDHESDPPLRLTRSGPAEKGAPAIVGKWRVDPTKIIEYTRDGLIKVRYPVTTQSGKWDSAANTIELPNGKGQFRLANGLLILKMSAADEQAFIRDEATKEEIRHAGVRFGDKPEDLDPP